MTANSRRSFPHPSQTCNAPDSLDLSPTPAAAETDDDTSDAFAYEWTPEPEPRPLAWQDDYTPSADQGAHLKAIHAKQITQLEMESAALAHHRGPTSQTELALHQAATQFGRAVARLHMHHLRSIDQRG